VVLAVPEVIKGPCAALPRRPVPNTAKYDTLMVLNGPFPRVPTPVPTTLATKPVALTEVIWTVPCDADIPSLDGVMITTGAVVKGLLKGTRMFPVVMLAVPVSSCKLEGLPQIALTWNCKLDDAAGLLPSAPREHCPLELGLNRGSK